MDGYKELNLCLCSYQCIRDVMIKECKSVKEFKFSILHMGPSNWLWCLVSTTLLGDSQNQSYLYLVSLIPFKLKVRSFISSMYFSWKYGLHMPWDSMGFGKCLFKLWRLELNKLSEFFPFFLVTVLPHTLNKRITI